jgi:pimeloyl-ACP methyl ester carboxylesterase
MYIQNSRSLALLCVLVSASLFYESAVSQPVLDEQSIEVDNRSVRVVTSKLDNRQPGEPVIVFLSGAGAPIENWNSIISSVAGFAPLLAYDRPGIGESRSSPDSPSPTWVASHLGRLLEVMNVDPPYLLVGHSWGGVLSKYFAAMVPDEVAGMLLIDPTDLTRSRADNIAIFESIGAGEAEFDRIQRLDEQMVSSRARPSTRLEYAAIRSFLNDQNRSPPITPPIPTTILLAGKPTQPPVGVRWPIDSDLLFSATLSDRIRSFSEEILALPQANLILVSNASHFVHQDDPEVVFYALLRMYRQVSL